MYDTATKKCTPYYYFSHPIAIYSSYHSLNHHISCENCALSPILSVTYLFYFVDSPIIIVDGIKIFSNVTGSIVAFKLCVHCIRFHIINLYLYINDVAGYICLPLSQFQETKNSGAYLVSIICTLISKYQI